MNKFKCQYLSKEEIHREADKILNEYNPNINIPVDIELIIEKHLNLHLL